MKFVVRHGPRELDLPSGRFLIGRSDSCQLPLDDPLVSRHHAAIDVTSEGATLRDLQSRNGVRLNGVRLGAPQALSENDKIGIGSAELVFARRTETSIQTLVQAPPQRMGAFGLMGTLADKALALGRGEEAERLLGPQLEELLREVEAGRKHDVATVERACEYALRIAQANGNPAFMSSVFRFYRALNRLPPSPVVDELCAVSRKLTQPSREDLRAYLETLRQGADELGPTERFLLGRLEGLERSLG